MQEKVIFVFPGQGAQYVGMGKDLFNEFAVARYTFQEISDIAHRDVADICFNGAESELNKPENMLIFWNPVFYKNLVTSISSLP